MGDIHRVVGAGEGVAVGGGGKEEKGSRLLQNVRVRIVGRAGFGVGSGSRGRERG
jgi:hypothetical protein